MIASTTHGGSWPTQLRPGAVRWVRASSRYDETIAFYRDLVGLPVVDEFRSSFGEDGTIFGLPGTAVQMEVVRVRAGTTADAGPFDQLVLYLDDAAAVAAATAPLRQQHLQPHPSPHPYWTANKAVVYLDPDGRGVVFAPWVYGRDPEPFDLPERTVPEPDRPEPDRPELDPPELDPPELRLEWYDGDRRLLRWLFEEAEDSSRRLDEYIGTGRVLVARRGPEVIGHLHLVPTSEPEGIELKNMAVARASRGAGVGRALIAVALRHASSESARRMVVATAAADVGNLRFYQRCGFRIASVEPDAFTPAAGYPAGSSIDGIPLLDRVWLTQNWPTKGLTDFRRPHAAGSVTPSGRTRTCRRCWAATAAAAGGPHGHLHRHAPAPVPIDRAEDRVGAGLERHRDRVGVPRLKRFRGRGLHAGTADAEGVRERAIVLRLERVRPGGERRLGQRDVELRLVRGDRRTGTAGRRVAGRGR